MNKFIMIAANHLNSDWWSVVSLEVILALALQKLVGGHLVVGIAIRVYVTVGEELRVLSHLRVSLEALQTRSTGTCTFVGHDGLQFDAVVWR